MKILKITLILTIISCFTFSCSDKESANEGGDENLANEQNALEEAVIAVAKLDSGIAIEGATKNNGAPPQPNSNLNLAVASNSVGAVQKSGFNLKFSTSETTVAGAYLQFKDTDNNSASNYFDIPVSSFTQGKATNTKGKTTSKNTFSKSNSVVDGDYEIDIDFDDAFPPGKFCGTICIYDSNNNISQPLEVCVEVEAWGGNASIVGTWVEVEANEEDDTTTITCNNNQEITVAYDETISEYLEITFNSDGNFQIIDKEEYKDLDYTATQNSCSAVYNTETEKYDIKETGKWAYNESNNGLTIVSFVYKDLLEPQYNEDYINGELILDNANVQIVNGRLVVTDSYTDGGQTYTDIYTFARK
jgi:hypothetical protein